MDSINDTRDCGVYFGIGGRYDYKMVRDDVRASIFRMEDKGYGEFKEISRYMSDTWIEHNVHDRFDYAFTLQSGETIQCDNLFRLKASVKNVFSTLSRCNKITPHLNGEVVIYSKDG